MPKPVEVIDLAASTPDYALGVFEPSFKFFHPDPAQTELINPRPINLRK
jgi:hypothetical protein